MYIMRDSIGVRREGEIEGRGGREREGGREGGRELGRKEGSEEEREGERERCNEDFHLSLQLDCCGFIGVCDWVNSPFINDSSNMAFPSSCECTEGTSNCVAVDMRCDVAPPPTINETQFVYNRVSIHMYVHVYCIPVCTA